MGYAVDGMRSEMDAIVLTFIVMVISFAISQTAFFWVVETTVVAWISTVIMLIAAAYWYFYCVRIINRFQWHDSRVVWDDLDEVDSRDGIHEPGIFLSRLLSSCHFNGDFFPFSDKFSQFLHYCMLTMNPYNSLA